MIRLALVVVLLAGCAEPAIRKATPQEIRWACEAIGYPWVAGRCDVPARTRTLPEERT